MRPFIRSCMMMLLIVMLLVQPIHVSQAAETVYATYVASDGLVITSQSPAWAEQAKLKQLHDELLQNMHGEEIKLLDEIKIYDGYPHGEGVAGQYYFQTVNTFFPAKPQMQPGKIELYGGKEHQTVASFAHTLAHEYGHHVTHYYTLKTNGFSLVDESKWKRTTYARMRGLSDDKRVRVADGEHRWQIAEIAAEDYVQLFGSPLAKTQTHFTSRIEQALAGEEPGAVTWNGSMYNIQPQENIELPMASEVPGLYDFFYKQMKGGQTGHFEAPPAPNLTLASYSQVSSAGYQLHFTWDIPGGRGDEYSYTLVTYSDGDQLAEPIVTRQPGEKLEANYGSVIVRRGAFLYTYQEPTAEGVRHYKLYAFGKNGWVVDSAVLTVDMQNPNEVKVSDSKVIPVEKVDVPEGESFGLDLLNQFNVDIDLSWLEGLINLFTVMIQGVISLLQSFLTE